VEIIHERNFIHAQAWKQQEFDFDSVYANNTSLELSAFDLKIIFGQLEQHTGKSLVDWRTAVTLPWSQAKILSCFLQAQIAWYERAFTPIVVPSSVRPAAPESAEDETPILNDYFAFVKKLHADIFGSWTKEPRLRVLISHLHAKSATTPGRPTAGQAFRRLQ
jgi:hypothetical protein